MDKLKPNWCAYLDHPTAGSGWRVVSVRKYGWKWLFLQDWGTKANFKMTLKKWAAISRRPMYKNEAGEWKANWSDKIHGMNPLPGVSNVKAKTKKATAKSRRKVFKESSVQAADKPTKKRQRVVQKTE